MSPPASSDQENSPRTRFASRRSNSRSSTVSIDDPPKNQGASSQTPLISVPTPRQGHRRRSLSMVQSDESNGSILAEENDDNFEGGSDVRKCGASAIAGAGSESANVQEAEDPEAAERQYTEEDPLTLKDRQSLINVDHPFGLPIWKPALYKKSRTINRTAETALHATPTTQGEWHLHPINVLWVLLFGLWLAFVFSIISALLFVVPFGGRRYSVFMFGLGWYLLWPFGKYVEGRGLTPESAQIESGDPGDGSRVSGYVPDASFSSGSDSNADTARMQSDERDTLLRNSNKSYGVISRAKADLQLVEKPRDTWLGKLIFWLALLAIVAPIISFVCLICWFLVITIPMAKLNWALLKHIFANAENLRFCAAPTVLGPLSRRSDEPLSSYETQMLDSHRKTLKYKATRLFAGQAAPSGSPSSTVLLCIYRAGGYQYYKYTVGGVNIFFVNLMAVVFFAIFDAFVLLPLKTDYERVGDHVPLILKFLASKPLVFIVSLASVIPLSYFIGMAVASISAQSSIGMGAVINATFGSIIEIILYAIALTQGKGHLVEGSIVGSLLAGVLLMPGVSMCSGAVRQKEQKFNAKSAGVTSTMLIMAIIGTLTPTIFYQTYGNVRRSFLLKRMDLY